MIFIDNKEQYILCSGGGDGSGVFIVKINIYFNIESTRLSIDWMVDDQ